MTPPTEADIKLAKHHAVFIGVPNDAWERTLAARRSDGAHVTYVIPVADRHNFHARYPSEGVDTLIAWQDDAQLRGVLFEMAPQFMGCMIDGSDEALVKRFCGILKNVIDLRDFDTSSAATLHKDGEPMANAIRNGRWIEDGLALHRLKGSHKGRTAVIIAAGPSIDRQWDELRRLRTLAVPAPLVFIVVGRTFKRAMAAGVGPDFVVEAEQYQASDTLWEWAPLPPPGCILATPIQVAPRILRGWPATHDRTIMLDHGMADLLKLRKGTDSIDAGNSVAHLAFNLAAWIGCERVAFAGIDFGYPDGAAPGKPTHADGTMHQGWTGDVIRCEYTHQTGASLPANDGTTIDSSPAYVNFKTLMEIQIAKAKRENPALSVVNFSPRGAAIDGAPYVPIAEFPCSPSSQPAPSSTSSSSPSVSATLSVTRPPSGAPASTVAAPMPKWLKPASKPTRTTRRSSKR